MKAPVFLHAILAFFSSFFGTVTPPQSSVGDIDVHDKEHIENKAENKVERTEKEKEATKVQVKIMYKVDITQIPTQAIVNPANNMLAHGGGVARAISKAAGPELQQWSDKQPLIASGVRVATGNVIVSPSFNLKKRDITHVIHAVGPDCRGPECVNAEKLLYNAWYNALVAADKHGIVSIAFPSISTGVFACSENVAATAAVRALNQFFIDYSHSSVKEVTITLWDNTTLPYIKSFERFWSHPPVKIVQFRSSYQKRIPKTVKK